jgi:hypothetical protein
MSALPYAAPRLCFISVFLERRSRLTHGVSFEVDAWLIVTNTQCCRGVDFATLESMVAVSR